MTTSYRGVWGGYGGYCFFHVIEDVAGHAKEWRFDALADKLPYTMPLHFIGAAEDVVVPPEQHIKPLFRTLEARDMDVSHEELQDGHTIPENRIALTRIIYRKIAEMLEKS